MPINYNKKQDSYTYDKSLVDFFINVGFVVTRKCNLKCIHCCETPGDDESSLSSVKEILDKLFEKGLRKICITGGEPLMRKDIVDILKYAHKKGLIVTFSTNGTMLDRNKLSQIKPFISNIRFSIYGGEGNHDRVTSANGNYKKVIECLKLTKELKITTGLIMTVMKNNLNDLRSVINICNTYNVGKLYLFSLMPTARGEEIYSTEYVSPENISKEVSKNLSESNKCVVKVIDWRIEGQCILAYENGDIVAQPSYSDVGNKKIVGNLFKEVAGVIWEKYPFKKAHIDYYLDYH